MIDLNEQDLFNIFSSSPVGLCILDAQTLICRMVNDSFLEVAGKSRDAIIGQYYWDSFAEVADVYQPALANVVKTGEAFVASEAELNLIRNGREETVFVSFKYIPVKDPSGQVKSIAVWVYEKTAEVQSRLLIAEAEKTLRNLIMQAPVAVIVFRGADMRIAAVNSFMLQLLGKTAEIEGQQLLDAIPELTGQEPEALLHKVFETGQPEFGMNIPVMMNRDGETKTGYFNFSYTALIEEGRIVGVIDMAVEVTAQVIAHQEVQQRKDDFISIASHELKTPITSLKASLQLMDRMKNQPDSPMLPKLIEQGVRSMDKISELVDALLNASQRNGAQPELNKSTFTISRLLDECCSHVRADGVYHLVFEGDAELQVTADEHRIDQVVINFVNNAVKYASEAKTIYLIAEDLGDRVRIGVRDDGPGIPADQQEHLFERYYRSDHNSQSRSGLGLGLFISAEIVRRHGGEIGVDSTIGKGSTFWFTLPA